MAFSAGGSSTAGGRPTRLPPPPPPRVSSTLSPFAPPFTVSPSPLRGDSSVGVITAGSSGPSIVSVNRPGFCQEFSVAAPSFDPSFSFLNVGASEGFRAYGDASNFWQGKQVNSPTGKLHYGSECTDGLRSDTPEFVTDSNSCSNSEVSILPISSRIAPVRGVHISEPVTMKVACNKFSAETMYTFSKEENMVQHNTTESSVRAPSSLHKGMPYSHVLNPIPSELLGAYDSNCSYDKYISELESPTTEPMVYYYPAKACSISTSFQSTAPAANVTSSYTGLSMRKDKSFTVEDRYGTHGDNVYHVSLKEQHRMNQNFEGKENCNVVSRITTVQTYPGISMDYFSSLESNLEKPRLHSMGLTTALKTNHVDLPNAFTSDYGLAEPVHSPSQNSSGTLDQTVDSPCWKGASVSVQSPFSSLEPKLLHESTESESQVSRLLHSLDGSKRLEGGLGPSSVSEKCRKDLAVTAEYSDCLSSLEQVRREESSSVLPTMQQKCEDTCKTLLDSRKQIHSSGSCREENVEARSDKEREPDDKDSEVALLGQVSVLSSSQPKLTSGIANRKTSYKCVMHGNSSESQPPVTDYATPSAIVESLGSSLVMFKEASLNVFLGTLQYLSERLLSSGNFDTSELKDHDHEVIRRVIDNLEAFSIMNKKDVSKGSYPNSELAAAQPKTMMDHDGKNLSNINISHEKGNMQCLAFNYDQDGTKKIQEKKDSEQEENLQSLVYKKLWIDAEAALCSMKYKLQLAQMKTESVNLNCQAEGNSQQLSRLNFVYEENENTLLKGKQSRPPVELSADKQEVDPSVMARLNVLKGRHDRPSSDKVDVDPSVMARLDILNGRDGGSSCMFTKNQQMMLPSDMWFKNDFYRRCSPETKSAPAKDTDEDVGKSSKYFGPATARYVQSITSSGRGPQSHTSNMLAKQILSGSCHGNSSSFSEWEHV